MSYRRTDQSTPLQIETDELGKRVNHSMRLSDAKFPVRDPSATVGQPRHHTQPKALELVIRLCDALAAKDISYCHWKSTAALAASATGDNDLDLLIRRDHAQHFTAVLHQLSFKEARPPRSRESPSIAHFIGLDDETGRFVHVHAHSQLILGHDTTKNYRLPIEDAYLASSTQEVLFRVPDPHFEFITFVVRMVLKHSTWDSIVCGQGVLKKSEQYELQYLIERVDLNHVSNVVDTHLRFIDHATFDRCLSALTDSSLRLRMTVGRDLQRGLAGNARRPPAMDTALRLWRRVYWRVECRVLRRSSRKTLVGGGALIAIVGGDGAGKTSVVNELCSWFSEHFMTTRVHLGKPPPSVASAAVRAAMILRRRILGTPPVPPARLLSAMEGRENIRPGTLWLLRHVLTSRDRFRTYVQARRFADGGSLVISDRYPLRQIRMMDGPVAILVADSKASNPLIRRLACLEITYYERIPDPDLLVVLKVDPDIAVVRRSDEDEEFVRARCNEMQLVDWSDTPAVVVDASRGRTEVLSQIKSLVWSRL